MDLLPSMDDDLVLVEVCGQCGLDDISLEDEA